MSMLFVFGSVAVAQTTYTPNVQVAGTGIVDGAVTMVRVTVPGPGWVVIHADADGKPGPVIGYAPVVEGETFDVVVDIDVDAATPILHAMLHVDAGKVGVYEFPGPDGPMKIGDSIVMALFSAAPVVEEVNMKAPAAMPGTGAATSTPLIFAVTAVVVLVLGAGTVVSRRRA
jgi:hypothetical protein